jgi:hypothetical protein
MSLRYDTKIQLAILDEVAEKSDGKNPIKIDLTDDTRYFNYQVLHDKECFGYLTVAKTQDFLFGSTITRRVSVAIIDLSRKGYKLRSDLAIEIEQEQWQRDQNNRDRVRFRYDTVAVFISILAFILSVLALIRSW